MLGVASSKSSKSQLAYEPLAADGRLERAWRGAGMQTAGKQRRKQRRQQQRRRRRRGGLALAGRHLLLWKRVMIAKRVVEVVARDVGA